jgi:hypothetical protein
MGEVRFYRKYQKEWAVLCKCPNCETLHLVKYEHRPIVMPRIFCDVCKYKRYDNDEGEGYIGKTKKAGRKKGAQ